MEDCAYRLIKNGTIVTATKTYRANLYIRQGKIAAISEDELDVAVENVVDAAGKLILPGFIDTHVHSRDGKMEHTIKRISVTLPHRAQLAE